MSQYREKSRFFRIVTWKRVLILTCCAVTLTMIIHMSSSGQLRQRMDGIAAKTEWDKETVELFKRQLGFNEIHKNNNNDPSPKCPLYLDDKEEYLFVTGFPGPDVTDLETQLWLYFNLMALEKTDRGQSPIVRFLLPSKSKAQLEKVFEGLQFGDLSQLIHCVTIDDLLTHARVIGHFEVISMDEREDASKVQLIILNEGTKRLTELADYEFSFSPYRPAFDNDLMQKVQKVVRSAVDLSSDDSGGNGDNGDNVRVVDTVPLNFIGVSVEARDNVRERERERI